MTKIYRYEVPIDDELHKIDLYDAPMLTMSVKPHANPHPEFGYIQGDASVSFWAFAHLEKGPGAVTSHEFRVYGTGQEIPDGSIYWGTVASASGFVWHLIEENA